MSLDDGREALRGRLLTAAVSLGFARWTFVRECFGMYRERRAMFKAAPVRFLLMLALVPVFGLGLVLLLFWYLECRFQTVELSNGLIVYRRGVLRKEHIELQAAMVRSTRVEQGLLQRIFDIGDIYITSSGSSPEIVARGMPGPKRLRDLISASNSGTLQVR